MTKRTKERGPRRQLERLHRTVDVPQANKLENVRQLAAAVREGIHHPTALLELLDVDHRHFAYYRQAALILGVIDTDDEGLTLSDRGQELLATAEGSADERIVFRRGVLAAPALKPFSAYFEGDDVELAQLAHRLGVLTGLSHSTAMRRAQTLVQWRRYITGPGTPDVGVMAREKCEHGTLVTTSDFSTHALKVAKEEPRLRLVTGAQLVDPLAHHAVGLRLGRYGEIVHGAHDGRAGQLG
ncbi:MAG: restriction endonuclease [Myxococcales bacterium]|nr:restriction endonuclease [Myxococcales bacterium]